MSTKRLLMWCVTQSMSLQTLKALGVAAQQLRLQVALLRLGTQILVFSSVNWCSHQ